MCICLTKPLAEPTNTLLINIPCKIINDTNDYNMVFYMNNIKGNNTVMVIPYMVGFNSIHNDQPIGMIDMTNINVKELIGYIDRRAFERAVAERSGPSNNMPLQVFNIGNYNISIARSIDDVINKVNWNKFTKPADFNDRINTLNNESLYPRKFIWIYIIAQSIVDIDNDGFGFIIPSYGIDYFPTAHEEIQNDIIINDIKNIDINDTNDKIVRYDVNIINISSICESFELMNNRVNNIITNKYDLENVKKYINGLNVIFDDNTKKIIILDEDRCKYINAYSKKHYGTNMNYFIKNNKDGIIKYLNDICQ